MHDFAEGQDKESNINYLFKEINEINKEFPLLKKLDCHKSLKQGGHFWDLILEMEFETFDDLQRYQDYPRHVKLHEFSVKVRSDRAVVDYEI